MRLPVVLGEGVVVGSWSSSTSSSSSSSCSATSAFSVVVLGDVGLGAVDVCGRRPGKSGTRTVTSDCSDSRLGSGVVVGGVVDVELVVAAVVAALVDSVGASAVDDSCAAVAFVDASVAATVDGCVTGFVGVGAVTLSASVLHMVGPADVNIHGGRGRGVGDAGVAVPT